jgi:CheY-like chemotaxis protein
VEDEVLVQALAVMILDDAGLVVEVASTGQEALLRLDVPGSGYRALITDIDLGPGPNGWDVADHARRRFPHMPVVYVSGGSAHQWGCLGVAGSIMLTKPYTPAQSRRRFSRWKVKGSARIAKPATLRLLAAPPRPRPAG